MLLFFARYVDLLLSRQYRGVLQEHDFFQSTDSVCISCFCKVLPAHVLWLCAPSLLRSASTALWLFVPDHAADAARKPCNVAHGSPNLLAGRPGMEAIDLGFALNPVVVVLRTYRSTIGTHPAARPQRHSGTPRPCGGAGCGCMPRPAHSPALASPGSTWTYRGVDHCLALVAPHCVGSIYSRAVR